MFLHIDIDAFFASAECAADPFLAGKPMAVGSRSNLEIFDPHRRKIRLMNENSGAFVAPVFYTERRRSFEEYFVDEIGAERKIRGIITSASYEARACGVKTAMSVAQALRLCPEMIVIPSNYAYYHRLSRRLHQLIAARIPKVEQYSIDEFFGDVSGWVCEEESERFARALQEEIRIRLKLPVSIGIAHSKWIAKLATNAAKPYGIKRVEDTQRYIEQIPIEAFPGIGRGFERRLRARYISTLGELSRSKRLLYSWKKPGIQLYKRVTGMDGEGVSPERTHRQSIGISRTFDPIEDSQEIRRRIMVMARHIVYMVMEAEENPTLYTLKIKYAHGMRAKSTRKIHRLFSESLYKRTLDEMFVSTHIEGEGAVKLSLSVSGFVSWRLRTLSLLDIHRDHKHRFLTYAIHRLRQKFGLDILKTANEL